MHKDRGPCFAISGAGKCTALKKKAADCGRKCPFYRPVAEQEKSVEAAKKRCDKLGIPFGEEYIRAAKGDI